MRTAALYGALLGALQFLATLLIYAFGLHGSPEDLKAGHLLENVAAFVAMMACLTLGLRAVRRERHALGESFTFLTGFNQAFVLAAVGGFINGLGQYAYVALIHPAYSDHFRAVLIEGVEFTEEQAPHAEAQLDFIVSPFFRALYQGGTTLMFTLFVGIAFCLLFRDRPASSTTSPTRPGA